jgi:hypothetical protein
VQPLATAIYWPLHEGQDLLAWDYGGRNFNRQNIPSHHEWMKRLLGPIQQFAICSCQSPFFFSGGWLRHFPRPPSRVDPPPASGS